MPWKSARRKLSIYVYILLYTRERGRYRPLLRLRVESYHTLCEGSEVETLYDDLKVHRRLLRLQQGFYDLLSKYYGSMLRRSCLRRQRCLVVF